jgi:hypothetical protein
VSIVHRKGVIDTPAATNEAVRRLDELQFALKEGPCFDAIWNLYSRSLDAFDPDDLNNGYYLAAHLAIAIAGAETTEQLTSAIASRTAIGQAEGILMERFDLLPAQAFAVLTRISQHSNVRLHLVALELVNTRKLPGMSNDRPGSDDG